MATVGNKTGISRSAVDALISPRAVAVVGASGKSGKVGNVVLSRFSAMCIPVYPVNPGEQTVLGRSSYASIDALPDEVDLAVIATSAERAVEAVRACAGKGIAAAIVIASGFAEAGRPELEQALQEAAGAVAEAAEVNGKGAPGSRSSNGRVRILGPNTLGVIVPKTGLNTVFVDFDPLMTRGSGSIAFITQSGSVGVEAVGRAAAIGFGLRAFVGLGNAVDLAEAELVEYFASDEETSCIALYLENVAQGRRFLEVAREATRRVPVVAVKAGRSTPGLRAAASHTGKLAGEDRVVEGAFRQYGIIRARDDEDLCDTARVLSRVPSAAGGRVGIITPAGGFGVECADAIAAPQRARLSVAELDAATRARLREIVLPYAAVGNPVDLTASATDDMTIAAMQAMLDDDGVDIILPVLFFSPPGITDDLIERVGALAASAGKPIVALSSSGGRTDEYIRRLWDHGVVAFPSVARTVRAIERILQWEAIRRANS